MDAFKSIETTCPGFSDNFVEKIVENVKRSKRSVVGLEFCHLTELSRLIGPENVPENVPVQSILLPLGLSCICTSTLLSLARGLFLENLAWCPYL